MKRQQILTSVLVLGLLLALAVGLSLAQEPEPPEEGAEREMGVAAPAMGLDDVVPIQGRLTDASGNPLDGMYSLTFSLYDVSSGGTALCSDIDNVEVSNGLFNAEMDYCTASTINGQRLYLGIKVESDAEMTPRQKISAVPYAWGLRPGAIISDTRSSAILNVENYGSGTGVTISSSDRYGVDASSSSSGYAAVLGCNDNTGIGVQGVSIGGVGVSAGSVVDVALKAVGTGIIQSTAKSYLWISGNGVRPHQQSDSTVIDLDSIGGAIVTPGAAASARYVMLPVTAPGPLYGQDVTISDLDIYWVGDTDTDAITDIRFRRQTGVCDSCYVEILHDATDHTCYEDTNPTGCTIHYDLTSNNVLTADSGVLYLVLQLTAIGNDTWIRIGGARLTLEHD